LRRLREKIKFRITPDLSRFSIAAMAARMTSPTLLFFRALRIPVGGGLRAGLILALATWAPVVAQPLAPVASGGNTSPPPVAVSAPAPPLVLESKYFEVAGPDYTSVQAVMDMTPRLQTLLARYFAWPDLPARPIQIQLVPAAQAGFAAAFQARPEPDGHGLALVRWNADTKFSDVCLALSAAALESSVAWNNSPPAAKKVPDWLKIAFGIELEVALRPALEDALAEDATRLSALSLRQIMTARGPYGDSLPVLEVNAYWLQRFLDETSPADSIAPLMQHLAAGDNPASTLRAAFPGQFPDPATLELWWSVGYRDIVARHVQPVAAMGQTRALLDQLETIVVEVSGGDQRLTLDQAWAARASPRVKSALQDCMDQARPALVRANPVYYNALLSLTACFDAILRGSESAYYKAAANYVADRAKAEAIEAQVRTALGETNG
jgi:hypothetical protein